MVIYNKFKGKTYHHPHSSSHNIIHKQIMIKTWLAVLLSAMLSGIVSVLITQHQFIQIQYYAYLKLNQAYLSTYKSIALLDNYLTFYLILTPVYIYFMNIKHMYFMRETTKIVVVCCMGRYLAGTDQSSNYFINLIVLFVYPLVIIQPYTLLDKLPIINRMDGTIVILFVPRFIVNLNILYKYKYIAGAYGFLEGGRFHYIELLSQIVAFFGVFAAAVSNLINMGQSKYKLMEPSNDSFQNKQEQQDRKYIKQGILILLFTGIVVGSQSIFNSNWYNNYLNKQYINNQQPVFTDIIIDALSAIISCRLFRAGFHKLKGEIVLLMNIIGIFGLIVYYINVCFQVEPSKVMNVLVICMIRVGILSFICPIINSNKYSSTLTNAGIIIYTATLTQHILHYIFTKNALTNRVMVQILTLLIIISMIFIEMVRYQENERQSKKKNVYQYL